MDQKELTDTLQVLEQQARTIAAAIEALKHYSGKPKRRGRHFMGPEERQVVSERMKRFWQKRRENAS